MEFDTVVYSVSETVIVTCVCVFFLFFRAAVRAFSLACPTYYCFITLHILSFLANKRERERLLWEASVKNDFPMEGNRSS